MWVVTFLLLLYFPVWPTLSTRGPRGWNRRAGKVNTLCSYLKSKQGSLHEARSTRCHDTHSYCTRRYLKYENVFNSSPGKPRHDVEIIFKTYDLLIYGVLHYVTNPFCKSVLEIATHWRRLQTACSINCLSYYKYVLDCTCVENTQVNLATHLLMLRSVYWIPCCPNAD
jgi:hypothetical protein